MTDAPSFLVKGPDINNELNKSNETLCLFDPVCKYIPDIDPHRPGLRIIDLQYFRRDFQDMLSGYSEAELFQNDKIGTLFRFPLRMAESELSHHEVTPDDLDELLKIFEKDVLDMLLFVKHVTTITISNISSGQLVKEYSVRVSLSEDNQIKRENLSWQLEKFANAYDKEKSSVFDLQYTRDLYKMTVTDSRDKSRSWCIVQQIGIESNVPIEADIRAAYGKGHIGLLPQGGVAVLLHQQSETSQMDKRNGKAFCVLPLPIDTGLPVEVHGHFLLDHETRRSLWEDDGSYKTKWNQLVLRTVVAPAYVRALEFCLHTIFNSINVQSIAHDTAVNCLKRFEDYFPILGRENGKYWKWLSQFVYQYIYDNGTSVFPVFTRAIEELLVPQMEPEVNTDVSISWTALKREGFKFPAYFVPEGLSPNVVDILQRLGMSIVRTSTILQESMRLSEREARTLSEKSVINFLRSHNNTYMDKCQIGVINRPVEETCFKNIDSVCTIAQYCLTVNAKDEIFDGIPLLDTNDGFLRQLDASQTLFLTEYCNLMPSLGKIFVSDCLVSKYPSFLYEQGFCEEFLIEDFLEVFPQSDEHATFGKNAIIKWNPQNECIPNLQWIQPQWNFIWNEIKEKKHTIGNALSLLGPYSFIPSTALYLHPVSELYT